MNTANPTGTFSDPQAIRASITSVEARLAVVCDIIRAELQRRYWQGYWSGSRAFLRSVKTSQAAGR